MTKKTTFLIWIYIISCFIFWFTFGLPVMKGEVDFKFYSDSRTYEELALTTDDVTSLIRISGNQVGPVLICKFLGPTNYTAIFILNLLIFLISIKLMLKDSEIYGSSFLIFMFINTVTFTSIFAINKEIFSFLVIALVVRYIITKDYYWIFFAFIISLIVRWQLSLFLIIVAVTFSPLNFLNKRRVLYIFILLIGITGVLFYTRETLLGQVFLVYELSKLDKVGGVGSFDTLMDIQNNYGYIFAFVPKALHLLVGFTTRFRHFLNPDPPEMYNDVVLYWMGPINLFVLITIFRKRLFNINNNYVFIALIYLIIFSITPIYNIRYFYPISILLSFVIFNRESNSPKINT